MDPYEEMKPYIDSLVSDIEDRDSEIKDLKNYIGSLEQDLYNKETSLDDANEDIANLKEEVEILEGDLAHLEKDLDEATQENRTLRMELQDSYDEADLEDIIYEAIYEKKQEWEEEQFEASNYQSIVDYFQNKILEIPLSEQKWINPEFYDLNQIITKLEKGENI